MKDKLTGMCIWMIRKLNRAKDQQLSYKLHNLADSYDRRPKRIWE